MSLEYLFSPTKQFTYPSGKLLDGGKIFVYFKDTTDLVTLYSPNGSFISNPILLDANGRASVRADIAYQYRLEVYTNDNVLLYTCEAFCEGDGSGGFSFVIHDETLSGNGTASSPLGVINIPLAVEDSLTAYEDIVEGKNALVLGVNSAWLNDKLDQELSGKVDRTEFEDCCSAVNAALDNKLDISAYDLSNYYNKQETNDLLDQRVDRYEFAQTMNWVDQTKQDKLEFGYDESSAISSINNSALAGQGGGDNCPWISGSKVIADTQTLTSNMLIQVLSSFDLSGYKNHNIGVKGGIYRFPNEYEIGSALLHTNYFMHLSGMSAYLPLSSFSSYTASIANSLQYNWDYTNSAYSMSLNNFYNKLDISAFSAWSAVQDPVLIGDSNITATSSRVDNHTQWNLAVNGTPVVTDTRLVGDNCVTAHTTETSGEWIVGLVQSAYEAIDSIDDISNDVDTLKNASGNYYPMTGNPSGFLTAHQSLTNYYTKTDTSSKQEISAALQYISANAGHTYIGDNPIYVNNETNHIGITGESLSAGPGIDIFSSGGYVVISSDGAEAIKNISAGEGILVSSVGDKTIITNNISAGEGISLVYDNQTNKIRIDVDNTNDYELSAGNGVTLTDDALNKITRIDCTSNGFPMTGTDGTANYTANANFSAFTLTTGQGAAGCYVNLDAKNVHYESYPSTDVSASWYNIINKANEPSSNCYCIRFTDDMTAADLANYSSYDKVTVVHSNEYAQDCHLYWAGNTKVFPSGLYCELVKGTNDQNQIDWFFTTSGWTNKIWWDWD